VVKFSFKPNYVDLLKKSYVFISLAICCLLFSACYSDNLDHLTYDPHHTEIAITIDGDLLDFSLIKSEMRERDGNKISRMVVFNLDNTRYLEFIWKMKEDNKHFDFGAFPEVHYVYFKEGQKYEFEQAIDNSMKKINLYHDDTKVLHLKGDVRLIPLNDAAKSLAQDVLNVVLDLQKGYDG
jgi:hypothetical protein